MKNLKNFHMSSRPPPPPPGPQKPLDDFNLPSKRQRFDNKQSTNDLNQGDNLPQSSLSSKKQPLCGNATASGQSTLKKSYILDWLHGRLPEPPTGKSSSESSPKPDLNTTDSSSNV